MDGVWNTIIGASSALLGTYLGSYLTYKWTSKTKIWDLRREAYGVILAQLSEVEAILDTAREYIQENSARYFEEVVGKHNAQIGECMAVAEKRFKEDYLILSDEFISMYSAMNKECGTDDDFANPEEEHDSFDAVIRKYRPKLLTQARTEIGVHKPAEKFSLIIR